MHLSLRSDNEGADGLRDRRIDRVSPGRSDHGGKHRRKRVRGPMQGMFLFQGGSIHPYVTEMLDKRDLTVKPPTGA